MLRAGDRVSEKMRGDLAIWGLGDLGNQLSPYFPYRQGMPCLFPISLSPYLPIYHSTKFRSPLLVLENLLVPLGFEVVTADDGEQAIALATQICPNLILLDLIMPKLNGWETAARMRQIPSLTSIPIIAVSASISEAVYEKSEKSGCDAFLSKPVELQQLLKLLAQYLSLEWVYSD